MDQQFAQCVLTKWQTSERPYSAALFWFCCPNSAHVAQISSAICVSVVLLAIDTCVLLGDPLHTFRWMHDNLFSVQIQFCPQPAVHCLMHALRWSFEIMQYCARLYAVI